MSWCPSIAVGLAAGLLALPGAEAAAVVSRTDDASLGPPPAESWQAPGMRLAVRLGPEKLWGAPASPAGLGVGLAFEPAVQVAAAWSVGLRLHYVRLLDLDAATVTGFRFGISLGPSWHWRGLALGLGAGLAGLYGDWRSPATGPQFVPPSGSCDGTGGLVQGRLDYLIFAGHSFATGPSLQGEAVGLRCAPQAVLDASGAEVGTRAVPPWWQQTLALMWTVAWR